MCGKDQSQGAPDRTYPSVEGEFTEQGRIACGIGFEGSSRPEDSDRHGEIEPCSMLREFGGRQVDRHPAIGEAEARGRDGCPHPRGTLSYGRLWKAHDLHPRKLRADPHLHIHRNALDAGERRGPDLRQDGPSGDPEGITDEGDRRKDAANSTPIEPNFVKAEK